MQWGRFDLKTWQDLTTFEEENKNKQTIISIFEKFPDLCVLFKTSREDQN